MFFQYKKKDYFVKYIYDNLVNIYIFTLLYMWHVIFIANLILLSFAGLRKSNGCSRKEATYSSERLFNILDWTAT